MPIKQRVYVRFEAMGDQDDVDPEALTARLGVAPTESHRKGDERASGQPWQRSGWTFSLSSDEQWHDEADWGEIVPPVLALLTVGRRSCALRLRN
jgi:hypothetical protein